MSGTWARRWRGGLALGALLALSGCGIRAPAQVGVASWYGKDFRGKPTASGEPFRPSDRTAAHRTLPFGTVVRVTNPLNGKSVRVIINDRGPFVDGRIIDLSRKAARKIGIVELGVAEVELRILGCKDRRYDCGR